MKNDYAENGVPGGVPAEMAAPFEMDTRENQSSLPIGYQLEEYVIQAVLLRDRSGIIYRAYDPIGQRPVGIREYLPDGVAVRLSAQNVFPILDSDDDAYREGMALFLSASKRLAAIQHPAISRVIRFFEANNTAYRVSECERGQTLEEWRRTQGDIDERMLRRLFLSLFDGLEAVHGAGIVHGDIQPSNIQVRQHDGSLVLFNFRPPRPSFGQDDLPAVVSDFTAPEQAEVGRLSPQGDIYGVGGVLYWMVTGKRPLDAATRRKGGEMPGARALAKGRFSDELLRAIDSALALEAADRPGSIDALRSALIAGAVAMPEPSEHVPGIQIDSSPTLGSAPSYPRTMRRYGALGATAVLLTAGGVAMNILLNATPKVREENGSGASISIAQASREMTPIRAQSQPQPVAADPAPPSPAMEAEPAMKNIPAHAGETRRPMADLQIKNAAASGGGQAYLVLDVTPWGSVYINGKKVGVSPPLTRIPVSAGRHVVEIHGTSAPGVYHYRVDLQASEKKHISARFFETL